MIVGESIESLVDSMTEQSAPDARGFIDPGQSPTFYTMLLFHRAFCEYTFNDNYGFLLKNDSYYGNGTFGQLARHMAERTYVMHRQLEELKDGGWRGKPQFAKFVKALEGIPKETEHGANLEFFESLPDNFIKIYEDTLTISILDQWRDNKKVMYQLGGEPELAKAFANALVFHKENAMGAVDANGDGVDAADRPKYQFTSKIIELNDQHKMSQGRVKVDVKECMEFVLAKASLDEVVSNKFVDKHWDLITELAAAEQTVRLFDYLDNGEYCV